MIRRHLYAVFDSLDRQCSAEEFDEELLYGTLQALRDEEDEEPLGLSYVIKCRPVARPDSWTTEF